jgi:hypothetical protein
LATSSAIGAHKNGHLTAAPNQQGFVPHITECAVLMDGGDFFGMAPVAARHHAQLDALGLPMHGQSHDQGCFTGTTRDHIANDDDRHAWTQGGVDAALTPPPHHDQPGQATHRPQQGAGPAA